MPLLKKHLRPAAAPDRWRIAQLINDLDDKQFAVREKAAEELEKLGQSAEPAAQKAFESHPSPEVRRRAEQLLQKLRGPITSPEMLRVSRSMMVLEQIGAPEAEAVLKELAKGDPEARLTREAKAALDRLAKRFAR